MRRLTWLLLWIPLLVFAVQPAYLTGLAIRPSPTQTTFTFMLSKKTAGVVKYNADWKQLIIDFDHTINHYSMNHAWLGNSMVKTIDSIQLDTGLRFILNLNSDIDYKVSYVGQNRLVLEIKTLPKPKKKAIAASEPHIFTVVVDAGHGGKDTGAIGLQGLEEKTVVLNIAKILVSEINKSPYMRAILTRSGDYFIPLRERLQIARKNNADLFIAIHADAHYDPEAEGVSVFALSQHGATNEAARWLAKNESAELSNVSFSELEDASPDVRAVLIDLEQTVTIQNSMRLGNAILESMDDISTLHYKKVEQAPFVVLKAPDIPSILVETGFISNPREEKRLSDTAYQHQIAYALQQGISHYVKKLPEEN